MPISLPGLSDHCHNGPFQMLMWKQRTHHRLENGSLAFIDKSKRRIQGVPQSQTAAFPRHQEEAETDKSKQAQIEQTYEKH